MEDPKLQDDIASEEISEPFQCCVCLDLLYKPIVLSCGHISCFWCVHKSMDALRESHCPLCRHPYSHFPVICQMLHFLLLKLYPVAYNRRENQILEEEIETGIHSPQFNAQASNHSGDPSSLSTVDFESTTSSDPLSIRKGEPCADMELSNCDSQCQEKNYMQVSVADVLCLACNQLLFRPIVLNCGHVYCESCVIIPAGEILKCQVCQTLHPRGFPKVCLALDHFLEERFLKDYVLRRDALQLKQVDLKHECPTIYSIESGKQGDNLPRPSDRRSKNVHVGVGCDSCGIVPIVGDRYRCKDCVEKIGFDLCGDCYNTQSKLPGRFNQQHTQDHKFDIVKLPKTDILHNMLRLVAGRLEDNSTAILVDADASEHSGSESPSPALPSDAQENAESSSAPTVASADGGEDQTGFDSTT